MEQIDSIRINFNPDQLFILNLCLAFLMFGVALDLKISNFRYLFKNPKAPLTGLGSQWLFLPLLTLLLIYLFEPPASLGLGMVLVAACPGGNVSNFAVALAGANAALSVFLTTVSTLGATVLTPLYFTLLSPLIPGAESLRQSIYVNPANMVNTIVQLIIIPLLLGMLMRAYLPRLTDKIHRPVRILSMAVFVGFVIVAVYSNFDNIVNYLHIVFLLVVTHNALALFGGYWIARGSSLPEQDARAISLETGIQNSGLGLILIFNFFDGLGGMALIAAWWGIWHLVSAFTLAIFWGKENAVLLSSKGG